MKATGIIRRIDDLGRIAIPKEVRRQLFGKSDVVGKPMEIFIEDGSVILKPYTPAEEKDDTYKLAEFIINNSHHCPIPIAVICKCGFKEEGCVECLLQHIDSLNLPKKD